MSKDKEGLEHNDEVSKVTSDEWPDETDTRTPPFNVDETDDEFDQASVDVDDLATGFDATVPTREIDVDEDTQGDEGEETNGELLLTELEVVGESDDDVRGDEVELDLDDALATGRTVTEAPEDD